MPENAGHVGFLIGFIATCCATGVFGSGGERATYHAIMFAALLMLIAPNRFRPYAAGYAAGSAIAIGIIGTFSGNITDRNSSSNDQNTDPFLMPQ